MQSPNWQKQLANAIRRPEQLLEYVGLDANSIGYSQSGLEQFPVRVPHAFADRITRSNTHDPILRQVFPYIDEETTKSGFVVDPLAESNAQPVPGLLKKYQDRVLVITTGACAIHCRYCFRRHFPYQESTGAHSQWQQGLEYIRDNNDIHEVIFSGGDPLSLSDDKLLSLCESVADIEHVDRIRLHTRFPVVLPDRINNTLLERLTDLGKEIVMVLHINHANEVDDTLSNMLGLLKQYRLYVLNQSVLLNGINNNVETLVQLSEKLVANHVVPYYLHLLDPVAGATHYEVALTEAQQLIVEMREQVAGYLVPTLVTEKTGEKSKTLMERFS